MVDPKMSKEGCNRALSPGEDWWFYLDESIINKGWFITGAQEAWCGEISYRADEAIRLCEPCLRRKGILW